MKTAVLVCVLAGCAGKQTTMLDDLESTKGNGPHVGAGDVAWRINEDGIAEMKRGNYHRATEKFRDAVARVPEAAYFFNLCMALYREGIFDEALVACNEVAAHEPTPKLQQKTDKLTARIKRR